MNTHTIQGHVRGSVHSGNTVAKIMRPIYPRATSNQQPLNTHGYGVPTQTIGGLSAAALTAYSAVRFYSKIRIAAAIVVVHSDFLSPTADCVMFIVRTILFDIR